TRPEGLGGSRDAGPAAAGPRPPYVTEAERHNNVGGGYGTATPYSGYGRTGRTGRTRPEGLGGSRDAGPAAAGPRPPYVTEAVRYSGCGYGTATPYSGYGRTGRTGRTKEGTTGQARRAFFSNTISL
ncbi:hypothetical protein L249_0634, partial [Ophiocordyceps polyrhachis-furcata BCC 54312]